MPRRTRIAAAALAVLLAAAGTAVAQTAQRFSDVPPDHEAHTAVEWAAEVGLTAGYGDGTFGPDDPLSRWQAVTFMERYFDQILGADGRGGFTSDRFTRGDMMMLLKSIDDGDSAEPESRTGRWLPRPDERVADGRCAHRVSDTDFYEWEDCAWGTTADPAMGRAEMEALAERVWTETEARGKPSAPPTLAEGQCRELRAAACYFPGSHTISIESGVTLRSLLHELAHALISGDPAMADCYADWTHVVSHCAHGPLFRCAADALYQRYADIDPAGVCGTVPDNGDWTLRTAETIDGTHRIWSVAAKDRWNRVILSLNIMCTPTAERVVYFHGRGDDAYSAEIWAPSVVRWRTGDQTGANSAVVTLRDSTGIEDDDYAPLWVLADDDADDLLSRLAGLSERGATGSDHRLLAELSDSHDPDGAKATLRTTGYRTTMADCE